MEELYTNKMKERLKNGEKLSACWVQLGSPVAAELVAQAGFDIAVIDCEHAPIDPINLVPLLQAMSAYDIMPMVRAPWNDMIAIKRLLDCGAAAVHIPYVATAEEALNAVKYCKYPPFGCRGIAGSPRACGFGGNRGQYLQRSNDQVLTMCAIETLEGIRNIDAMCEIEELDGLFIGPMDLSTNMGHFASPKDPEVQETIKAAEKKILAHGKLLGTVAGSAAEARALYERGYSYVIFDSDTTSLAALLRKEIKEFKEYIGR